MRKIYVAFLVLLSFTLTGCGTDVKKVSDEIGKVINAAVPLKSAAFLPNVLSWLGPIFDILSILAVVAFAFLAFAVIFGPKEGQGSEVTRGFVFIAGKVVLALTIFLADLFGKALWPTELTAVGVITKLGWGWPLKADLDSVTTIFAFSTMTFFPFWHVGVELLWTVYTVYGIALGSLTRNTEPLKRAIIGWIFWILSAFVWWFVIVSGIGAVVDAGNLVTSSGAHVNAVFIILTWLLMILSVTEPFRTTITNHVVPETVRVQAGGRIEELLEALVGGYVGAKVVQGSRSHQEDEDVIHAPDPQARMKLTSPRSPQEESEDSEVDTDPPPSGDDSGNQGRLSSDKTSGSVGAITSSRRAKTGASPTADGRKSQSSNASSTHVRGGLVGVQVANTRAAREERLAAAGSNGMDLPARSDVNGTARVTRARSPKEEILANSPRPVQTVVGDAPVVASSRDPQAEDGEANAFPANAQTPIVNNGDDGTTLYRAKVDIPDELGMVLIPAGSYIIPDETTGAVSNAGILSYGQLVTWDRIEKVVLSEEVTDE